jgi:outer membrane protein assembly factor BamB
MAGKKVFLCFAAEDRFRIAPLMAAFTAWGISPMIFDPMRQPPGQLLPETAQQIQECEVYLRLCTGATRRSPQVAAADATFRKLLAADPKKRKLVNLILDPAYVPDAQDKATLYIDTANKMRALWLEELAAPLGVATLKQRISRRALVGMGAGIGLAVVSGGVTATLLVQQQQAKDAAKALPKINGLSGQPRWTIPLGSYSDQSNVTTSLINDNGTYYATADILGQTADLFALSLADKTARRISLKIPADGLLNTSLLNIADGLIFAGYSDGPLNTIFHPGVYHVSDGSLAYQLNVADYSSPVIAGDSFYSLTLDTSGNTFVSAFATQTGKLRWQHPIVLNSSALFETSDLLTVANGAVYASAYDHTLTCYDAATGRQKWQFLAQGQMTAPVIVDGVVYAGARDGSLYALDADTGHQRWRSSIGAGKVAPPTVSDGTVYIGSIEGFLYAFDATNGAAYWSSLLGGVETNLSAFEIDSAPALYRNVVAVASQGTLFAYDVRNGSSRWAYDSVPGGQGFISPPVVAQGLFLFGGPNGKVYAVNP